MEATAGPAVEDRRPDLILGLGEGGPDAVALETIGRNTRGGDAVNVIAPTESVIIQGGDPERKSRFTFTWSAKVYLAAPIILSLNAGSCLCKNALHTYLGTSVERAGFVHVPPQGDDSEVAYCERFGPVVEEILLQNARVDRRVSHNR